MVNVFVKVKVIFGFFIQLRALALGDVYHRCAHAALCCFDRIMCPSTPSEYLYSKWCTFLGKSMKFKFIVALIVVVVNFKLA